jgi:hypothetical protein
MQICYKVQFKHPSHLEDYEKFSSSFSFPHGLMKSQFTPKLIPAKVYGGHI